MKIVILSALFSILMFIIIIDNYVQKETPICNNGVYNSTTKECTCSLGYITLPDSIEKCNYNQYNSHTVFCVQLLAGYTGLARIYIQDYYMGFHQLLLFILFCIEMFYLDYTRKFDPITYYGRHKMMSFVWKTTLSTILLWWVVDVFRFYFNFIVDGNNQSFFISKTKYIGYSGSISETEL